MKLTLYFLSIYITSPSVLLNIQTWNLLSFFLPPPQHSTGCQTLGGWSGAWRKGSKSEFIQLFSEISITHAPWSCHSLAICIENINLCDGDFWGLHDYFDVLILETKHPNYSQQYTFNWDTEVIGLSVAIVSESQIWPAA